MKHDKGKNQQADTFNRTTNTPCVKKVHFKILKKSTYYRN